MKKKTVENKESYNFEVNGKFSAFWNTGAAQFTSNGMLCLYNGGLKFFEIESGKISDAVERIESEEVISFLVAEDDDTLVTATKHGFMRHYQLSTKHFVKGWKSGHIGMVNCMAFDPTTTLLATGGSDSTVIVWDIVRKYITHHLKGGRGVYSKVTIQKLNDVYHVFGAADDYNIHVWNLNTKQHVISLTGHFSTVTSLIFFKENSQMLSSSRDKVVMLWDLTSFKLLKTIPVFETVEACLLVPEKLSLTDVSLSDNDTYFITAGDKGILKVWSSLSGKCVFEQTDSSIVLSEESEYQGPLITQATYVPFLEAIAVGNYEHNIILYSIENFTIKNQFIGHIDDVLSLKYIGRKDDQLAVATNSSQIKLFQLPSFSCQLLNGHNDIVLTIDGFPNHPHILVSGSKDNNVRVWNLKSDHAVINSVYIGYGHTDSVTAVCCCRGKSKFFASGSEDTTLKLWEIPEKKPLVALKLLVAPYKTVKAHDKLINSIDISENDQYIASGSQDHTVKIWNSSELSLLGTLRGHKKGVWCVKFSPVDLAVATSAETIRIWSLLDYSCLKVFDGHEASILQVTFLSRGTQLLSSAADGIINLWSIKNNICIKSFAEHSERVWTIATSSTEDYFASGGADSCLIVWKDITEIEKQAKIAEKEDYVLQEQELFNLVHEKKWTKALGMAITLDKPFQAYHIIEEILLNNGEATFENVLSNMRQDQRESLMVFSFEWLTNSRRYYTAVLVMNFFYKNYLSEELLKMPNMCTYIAQAMPYLDRHFKRVSRRCQGLHILNLLPDK
ncbi:transducin beta-like protein 3 [Caerostris extrusa]|uniref:Transducin beta-like protein 3 n=1 Tax=Caerostris extrusa TaxID=172846 RepID=A0AAV4SIS8_CAEEX|nr:transducin beta-like protein 3 [Caerostris extrusa]